MNHIFSPDRLSGRNVSTEGTMKKRRATRWVILVLVLVMAGGLIGFNLFRDKMIAGFFANMPQPTVVVSAVEAKRGGWRPQIEAIGTARASQGVELSVQIGGVVTEIAFKPNQRVEAGQVLIRIDDAVERAELRAAEAQLELAQTQLRRQADLRQRGVAAQSTYDEAAARVASNRAEVDRLRAVLDRKEIEAPFAGVVGIPRLDVGAYVQPGTPVVTLQDLDTMQVDFTVSEQTAGSLALDQPVEFRFRQGQAPLAGRIVGIDPRVDAETRLVTVRAEVTDAKGAIRPGEFVRANVLLPEENVIALPQTAVVNSLYGDYLYRVDKAEDGKLVARQVFVQVGRRSGGMVEVAKGIEPGQTVVTSGQNKLQNNAPVAIDNSIDPNAISINSPVPQAGRESLAAGAGGAAK